MCGLAGYFGLDADLGRPILQCMADAQTHRGPDGEGFFASGQIGLAHRRLAVIDKVGGEQPMRSADGRFVMVYNGEIYNFRELRAQLSELGFTFTTHSDTEVVLAAWRQWGAAAFDRFNGMFGLAIADLHTGEVTLARDQFGIKPLYVAELGDHRVLFASEIRPLLASGLIERSPDDTTIYRYVRFRVHDDTERTFFAGISRLLPGQLATISPDGELVRSTYTSLFDELRDLAAHARRYDAGAAEEFATAVRKAIRARLVSDVPVGTALSGGLDSSTVVATIDDLLSRSDRETAAVGGRQRTFSAVFPGERNDEERFVDAVTQERSARLRVHKVQPDVQSFAVDLRDFVRTQEEPVISTGPYAQYCVMRAASDHVTVMLDGQGVDEMMAGYLPYFLVNGRDLRKRGRRWTAVTELLRAKDVLWQLGRYRIAERVRRRSRVNVTELLSGEFVAAHTGKRLKIVSDDLKRRLEDDIFRHSLPALLRAEDRNTMRFSMEGRVPFLDVDLLRLLWSLDDTAIIENGWNKRALRDATDTLLPRMISRRRSKIGFTTPEDAWFPKMADQIREIFASESFASRPYFHQESVISAFENYLKGKTGADTMTFWRLLNVELWLREFIDSEAPEPVRKSDYVANPGKELVLPDASWARFPLQVERVAKGDNISDLAARRVVEFFTGLRDCPPEIGNLVDNRPWCLFIGEKVVAVAQGRSYFLWELRPGFWARTLARFVTRSAHGIGLGHPATMQLAISEVGLPRILLASGASAAGKAMGRRGVFYQITGPAVRAIDGPTQNSVFPANVSAKLAPADPDAVARDISAAVRASLPDEVLAHYQGAVIIDSNDLGRSVLGHDTRLNTERLEAAFTDNPFGQDHQRTPLAVGIALLDNAADPQLR